jgi:nicotinate-nucleotide pyrophosphorylase
VTSPEPPDRATILAAVMPALLATQASPDDSPSWNDADDTGSDTVVASGACVVAGWPVVREAFARLGVRCRPLVGEGAHVASGDVVAELGGAVVAIRRAAPVALAFLGRLSSVASGVRAADEGDELERYARAVAGSRLSPSAAVDDDGPSFRLGSEG